MNQARRAGATILLAALAVLSGCTAGVMSTSRQLKNSELVISGSLDTVTPRVSAKVAYGLGDVADLSANLGTSVFTYSVGAGGRFYPTDWLNVSLEGNYNLIGFFTGNDGDGIFTFQGKLTSSTKQDGRLVYGGLSTVVASVVGTGAADSDVFTSDFNGVGYVSTSIGLLGGIETDVSDNMTFQFELSYMPLGHITDNGFGLFPISPEGLTPFIAQLSFGINYRIGDEPAAKPTREADPDELPPRPRTRPPAEPDPVPTPDADPVPEPPADGPEAVPMR